MSIGLEPIYDVSMCFQKGCITVVVMLLRGPPVALSCRRCWVFPGHCVLRVRVIVSVSASASASVTVTMTMTMTMSDNVDDVVVVVVVVVVVSSSCAYGCIDRTED